MSEPVRYVFHVQSVQLNVTNGKFITFLLKCKVGEFVKIENSKMRE
jgi:hypothetical protein